MVMMSSGMMEKNFEQHWLRDDDSRVAIRRALARQLLDVCLAHSDDTFIVLEAVYEVLVRIITESARNPPAAENVANHLSATMVEDVRRNARGWREN
jgi:hypothetical protein